MTSGDAAPLYLDLMKQCLTRLAFPDQYRPLFSFAMPLTAFERSAHALLSNLHCGLYRRSPVDPEKRAAGQDWPAEAETMVGLARLDMLQEAVVRILSDNVPGDLIEAGAWRGGASIFLRAILKAYGDRTRTVWVADSFAGLPKPDGRSPGDQRDSLWRYNSVIGVPLEQVRANFTRYGLLDDQVRFLQGWFKDTLPTAPLNALSLMRLDGDMYSSTMDALEALYPKLSPGGYVVIDDYGALEVCRQAVSDYRDRHSVREPIEAIDASGVFWRKSF